MDTTHNYNLRSKINMFSLTENKTPALKTVDLTMNKKENSKLKFTSEAAQLLKSIMFDNILDKYIDIDDDDDDEDYKPVKGLPKEIIYLDDEKIYINNLEKSEQSNLIQLEKEILEYNKSTIPQRFKILRSNLNISTKSQIIKRLDHFYSMDESDNEYGKLSQWTDSLDKIPFDSYSKQSIDYNENNTDEIIQYLSNVKNIMDNSIYGHIEAKELILQEIANKITNPSCSGNCIAIQGPPGNGKTTLVKDGICKALGKPFAFIALGGMQNSEFLLGHDYTYEGSRPGRIVEILQECKTMDPIIYFDELDKLSDSAKGEEISNLLCHLTDQSQNSLFHDKYFSGIDFDLSKATFIFSYNEESKINPILLDRMTRIKTKGFCVGDKQKIAINYLLPYICKKINFTKDDIIFDNEILKYIIENYTEKEEGVRNLKRALTSIISKINILKLLSGVKDKSNNTDNITLDISKNQNLVTFNIKNFKLPLKLENSIVDVLLKKNEEDLTKMMMYT
uniref:AAA+ ATPase domain-containing protein n=1 Tax=viral metagenome TaxID=1070528 RepID=A0A6C0IY09_9ZZZZ